MAYTPVYAAPRVNSGPLCTEKLPWESDRKFLDALKKHNAYVRMGAFKTVLPDPLPGEEYNVHLAADMLAGSVIMPGKVFSQNGSIGPYTRARGFREGPTYMGGELVTTIGGGVCKIATTLYNVAIQSNLQIVERHNHSMIVPYVPAGQDATVYYGARDIKFRNNTSGPVMIWARSVDNTLYMAIYGGQKPPRITWHHQTLETRNTYTIYKKNPSLPKGTQKLILEGYNGYTVKTWLTVEMPDGSVKTRDLGIDVYRPMPRVVETGTGHVSKKGMKIRR